MSQNEKLPPLPEPAAFCDFGARNMLMNPKLHSDGVQELFTSDQMQAYACAAIAAQADEPALSMSMFANKADYEAAQAVGQTLANWYCIDKSGMAILCADHEDALENAKHAKKDWPNNGPYRAVQLFEHPPLQVGQSEPVAWLNPYGGVLTTRATGHEKKHFTVPLYTHPAPVREVGWQPIETAPKDCRTLFIVRSFNQVIKKRGPYTTDAYVVWHEDESFIRWPHNFPPTHWASLPLGP